MRKTEAQKCWILSLIWSLVEGDVLGMLMSGLSLVPEMGKKNAALVWQSQKQKRKAEPEKHRF